MVMQTYEKLKARRFEMDVSSHWDVLHCIAPSYTIIKSTNMIQEEPTPQTDPDAIDDIVIQLPSWRKLLILFSVCWMGLPVIFWCTGSLTATPELAADFSSTPENINWINAGVLVAMALSSLIWLPTATLIGRKKAIIAAQYYAPVRLGARQTILADVFEPTVRGTAVGVFLGSCVSANSIGSAIVTFTSWRVIYGLEAGMSFLSMVLMFFFAPEDIQIENGRIETGVQGWYQTRHPIKLNPKDIFRQFAYPRVLLANLTCGLLAFNQFGLLSSIRHIINPYFNLTSPLSSWLFYLAPGAGFLIGSIIGGKFSDITVRRYIRKRNNIRLAEDRLNSSLLWILVVLPLGALINGWSLEKDLRRMVLPVISSFVYGFGLMTSFSGLNTYSGEASPAFRAAVISSKCLTQYVCSAGSVGGVVLMIDSIGTGWAFTVSVFVLAIARLPILRK
ncbi:major facilitator superfamily domain-containing protein [Lipomyces kononenkoae]|uniref:Major facilitator superfamily domain-containing protein n=1 Tax=Lipomyces kononenkoae TaxID=34357 RepID=A0ACC3SS83_LIPKO